MELRNSDVIGKPEAEPITASIPQRGQSAVKSFSSPNQSTISDGGYIEPQ
jgi:hypothetical protein